MPQSSTGNKVNDHSVCCTALLEFLCALTSQPADTQGPCALGFCLINSLLLLFLFSVTQLVRLGVTSLFQMMVLIKVQSKWF